MALRLVADVGMAVGPVLPYAPQYLLLRRTRADRPEDESAMGFSPMVSFVLLMASLSRIFFWLLSRFNVVLLVQAVLMVIAQLAIVREHVRIHSRAQAPALPTLTGVNAFTNRRASLWDFPSKPEGFWAWDNFSDYVGFITGVVALLGILTYSFRNTPPFAVALGYMSLLCEATLAVPQVVRNERRKSTSGVSLGLVVGWVAGDLFKTVWFFADAATPIQFRVCGVLQLAVDAAIVLQLWRFRRQPGGGFAAVATVEESDTEDSHESLGPKEEEEARRRASRAESATAELV